MTKYNIEYSYTVPFWDSLELDAADKEDAELAAKQHVEMSYPEATEISIDNIKEVVVV
jgi:hypothetical protein